MAASSQAYVQQIHELAKAGLLDRHKLVEHLCVDGDECHGWRVD